MSSLETLSESSSIPDEVKRAVRGLDNPIRWKIVEILRAKQELSYTQLMESLNVRKGQLTYHLNKLLKGSILQNYSKDVLETEYDSFYAISQFGKSLLNSLVEPLQPSLTTVASVTAVAGFVNPFLVPAMSVSIMVSASILRPSFPKTAVSSQRWGTDIFEQLRARVKDVSPYSPYPTMFTGSAGLQIYQMPLEIEKRPVQK